MNKLSKEKQIQVITALVEGCSIRSTVRMTGVAKNTIVKLIVNLGEACQKYHDKYVVNLKCEKVQCDEIWSFVYAKQKVASKGVDDIDGAGDVYTWTAIDAKSKLIISWLVGNRDAECANEFMTDVASRLSKKVQLTTDGLKAYLEAVEGAFGANIDYAQLIKLYGETSDTDHRYSPAKCTGSEKHRIVGSPEIEHISTSFVERQNLTMRMSMRRFTRLTNAFSKKVANHAHSVAIYFMYYNFVRIHKTTRVTPAMEAGLTNKLWDVWDMLNLLDE